MCYIFAKDAGALTEDQHLFEMVNIRPRAFRVAVYCLDFGKGADVRVKVSPGRRVREFAATISVRPQIEVIAGELSTENLRAVRAWIDLNRDTIIKYWNGEILCTDEALAAQAPATTELTAHRRAG